MLKINRLIGLTLALATPGAALADVSESGVFLDGVAAIVNEGVVMRSELSEETANIIRSAQSQNIPLPPADILREQVLERLQSAGSAVSKATVYNTLGLFAERGLVREVMVDNTRLFYDSNTAPHCHFYNEDDGQLADIPAGGVLVGTLPPLPEGTSVDRVDVVVRIRNDA